MKVVLLDNIRGIGKVGDVKDVREGHARNYLLPRGLAAAATADAIRTADTRKTERLHADHLAREQALALAQRIEGMTVPLTGTANEKGTLFSAISSADIADRLSELVHVRIPQTSVLIHEHLKHTGTHAIEVRLADGVTATCTVDIAPASS